jgi:hypothetical protein
MSDRLGAGKINADIEAHRQPGPTRPIQVRRLQPVKISDSNRV